MSTGKHFYDSFLCLLFLTAACVVSVAQNPRFESLTIADGLSQGMIYDIEQSDDGFLWFATKDGLNRYDGYRFEVFTNDPFNPFSIAGNDINCLFEDSRGNIWVSVFGKGLDVLEKNTGRFFHLPLNTVKDGGASPPYVAEAPDSTIWVGTPDGLLRLRWKEKIQTDNPDLKASMTVEVASTGSQPGKTQFLRPFILSDGTIFTSISTDGVYRFDPINGKLTLLLPTPNSVDKPHFFESAPGRVWVKLDKKVFVTERNGNLREIPLTKPSIDFRVTHIAPDGKGNLLWCYTSFSKGSYFYTAPEAELLGDNGELHTKLIYTCVPYSPCFELDNSGNLWVGTNGYGLHKIHLSRQPFQHFLQGISIMNIIIGDEIYLTNYVRGGCDKLDEMANALAPTSNFPAGAWIFNMCKARKGTVWYFTGVFPGDQHFLGIRQGSNTVYRDIPSVNQYSPLREDPPGRLWAGAEDSRLMCILPANDDIVYFDLPKQLGTDARVFALYIDNDQNLWAGTSNGILKWNIGRLEIPTAGTGSTANTEIPITAYQVYQTEASNPRSLRHNFIASICPDPLEPERYLWFGTKGGGLNLLDKTTGEFQHFTSQNSGLPNDVVYGILPDIAGNLWMSTNRGLSRLTTVKGEARQYHFRNFREFDGLQSDEFNTGAFAKGNDGRLYFGGVKGLTVFAPSHIVDRRSDAQILITGLKINNLPVDFFFPLIGGMRVENPLTRPIYRTEQIRLNHTQNLVTLEFALMDFVNPQENRYRYRLQGVDPDWVEAGTSHVANYARLRPGKYVFEVQGSIGGGDWSAPVTLRITVLPPWWATWWAYLLYASTLGAAFFAFYKIRLRQKLEHQEALRLRELDEFKSRFFTNITHEFRTPLTVILGIAEQVEQKVNDEIKHKIGLIRRNGQNLLRLINQILDLAKLESNTLKINYVQGDVLPYLRYITESLHSFANAQNVMLRVESKEPEIVMDYDPERLLQIVHNLLSNAIKFTPSGGRVTLVARLSRAGSSGSGEPGYLHITVTDTGVGIPPEDLSKIFDRFYQAENQEHTKAGGTGIGLSLTKELVKAMGGDISVESNTSPSGDRGTGTTFTVQLPVTKNAPASDWVALASLPPSLPIPGRDRLSKAGETGTTSSPPLLEGKLILVVEDNPDVVEYLAACLSGGGSGEPPYVLDFAYNGRAGIEKALEIVPDLIISDVMMPEKDGFEVCDFLKNDERTSHIPIVLLTAKADVESRIAGLKRGADAYLAKPFHQEELLVTLANLLELRRKLQQKYASVALAADVDGTAPPTEITAPMDLENEFLKKLRLIVEENLSNTALDGELICRKIGMSRSNLHAKLSALTGMPITHFVRALRLRRAKELLTGTDMNVSEVAYEVGFDNPKYFTRVFSEEFGKPPSAFRQKR